MKSGGIGSKRTSLRPALASRPSTSRWMSAGVTPNGRRQSISASQRRGTMLTLMPPRITPAVMEGRR
jgi:hypothetical protein